MNTYTIGLTDRELEAIITEREEFEFLESEYEFYFGLDSMDEDLTEAPEEDY